MISYLELYYGNKLPYCVVSFCLKMNKSTFNHTNENQDDSLSSKREHAAIVFSLKNEVGNLVKALKLFQVYITVFFSSQLRSAANFTFSLKIIHSIYSQYFTMLVGWYSYVCHLEMQIQCTFKKYLYICSIIKALTCYVPFQKNDTY